VTAIEIREEVYDSDLKVLGIWISSEEGKDLMSVKCFMKNPDLSVRKISDSLVERIIEVKGNTNE